MRTPTKKALATNRSLDNMKVEPSQAQLSPGIASPTDFEIMENGGLGGETLPFDNSCGSNVSEYRKLLKKGRAENKFTFIEPDAYGRTLKA